MTRAKAFFVDRVRLSTCNHRVQGRRGYIDGFISASFKAIVPPGKFRVPILARFLILVQPFPIQSQLENILVCGLGNDPSGDRSLCYDL